VHDVEAVATDELVERRAELADLGSMASIDFGVNTRDRSERWMVWVRPSSWMSVPTGMSMFAWIISRITPRPLLNVSRSTSAASTSAKRLTA
jgi:hypothetical protein